MIRLLLIRWKLCVHLNKHPCRALSHILQGCSIFISKWYDVLSTVLQMMKGNWKQLYSVPCWQCSCAQTTSSCPKATLCVDDHTKLEYVLQNKDQIMQHMNMRSVFVENSNSVQLSPFVVAKFRPSVQLVSDMDPYIVISSWNNENHPIRVCSGH